jgi:GT2 family glycosyltransferase
MKLLCSVVIPSFNRAQRLDTLLAALATQDTDQPFEVIVVLDGSTDGSRDVVSLWEELGAFAGFQWTEQPQRGQATARNVGAFLARAPIVLFIDDDVIPDPDLISIHLAQHAGGERIAVLGDCDFVLPEEPSFLKLALWAWWEDTYHKRAAAWQPPSYRDFLTGNVSLRREDFNRVGGFDEGFTGYGGEDYELGYRLLLSGVRFVTDRRARGRHFNDATLRKMIWASRQSGHGDVLTARKHPELIGGLPLAGSGGRHLRVAAGLAMYLPWLGAVVCLAKRLLVRLWEFLGFRGRWLRGFAFVTWYGYWRGLRDATGSMKELRRLRERAFPRLHQEIDVARDVAPQVRELIVYVPSTILIRYEGVAVGSIDLPAHIEEPLLPWLVRQISTQLTEDLLIEIAGGVLPAGVDAVEHGGRIFETG